MSTEFLTVQELAKRYRVTIRTINNLRKAGRLPAPLKIGHSARWKVSDIQTWENTAKELNA